MTYNLRFANETDAHPWSQRRPSMVRQITQSAPHVLGTQEGLRSQLEDLGRGLPGHYAWVGQSREHPLEGDGSGGSGAGGEHCAVFFDARRLQVLDVTQRWFSRTPEVPGSQSWGACPRIMTAVSFADRTSGDELLVINTHLDHQSDTARRFAADYLLAYVRAAADGRPTVVMGDFNTTARQSAVYRRLAETPLTDTFAVSSHPGPERPSFTDYQVPPTSGPRIDWILVSPGVQVDDTLVDTQPADGRYASDHLPVRATVRMPRSLQRVGTAGGRSVQVSLPAWVGAERP